VNGELCPVCGDLQDTRIDWHRTISTDSHGDHNVMTVVVHCRRCGSFIRSDDFVEEDGAIEPHEEIILN
jgi:C4-type Zn-finger protein